MDPDATLRMLRETIHNLREFSDSFDEADDVDMNVDELWDIAGRMCEHAEDLDDWLGKGGSLPADWQRKD